MAFANVAVAFAFVVASDVAEGAENAVVPFVAAAEEESVVDEGVVDEGAVDEEEETDGGGKKTAAAPVEATAEVAVSLDPFEAAASYSASSSCFDAAGPFDY